MTSMCLRLLGGNLVQTGVVWGGARGILLDTETAECNMRRDSFLGGFCLDKRKQKRKNKKKKKPLINVLFFGQGGKEGEKKQQIFSRLK